LRRSWSQDAEGNTGERSPRLAPRRRLILLTDLLTTGRDQPGPGGWTSVLSTGVCAGRADDGGRIWTSLILRWISRSRPGRTCNRSCGMPVAPPSGRIRNGSRQAGRSPNLARRHGGDQGRPADDRQAAALGSRPAGFMSSFPGPDGRPAGPRRVMASGPATPVQRLLADAVPAGRRESPEHVTPAHQAGREAAQVSGKPTGMEDRMQTVTVGASHLEMQPSA